MNSWFNHKFHKNSNLYYLIYATEYNFDVIVTTINTFFIYIFYALSLFESLDHAVGGAIAASTY